jgi:hypothetical protein
MRIRRRASTPMIIPMIVNDFRFIVACLLRYQLLVP